MSIQAAATSFTTTSEWTETGEVVVLATIAAGHEIGTRVFAGAREAAERLTTETGFTLEAALVVTRKSLEALAAGEALQLLNGGEDPLRKDA